MVGKEHKGCGPRALVLFIALMIVLALVLFTLAIWKGGAF
jgi:hypothetical protein